MIRDFFDIISQCIAAVSSGAFFGVLLLSLLLGALCWIGCSYYTRLWHKRFHVRFQHHLLCVIAAVLTVVFTIMFQAVGNLELIVDDLIDNWNEELLEDYEWSGQTFETAYYAVKEINPAAFAGVPEPGRSGSYIPFATDRMMQVCVTTYVEEACNNFSTQHPFLDLMLSAQAGVSEEEITGDIREYFRTNSGMYPLNRAVAIAARYISEILLEQSPKTVWKTRLILVMLFLAVQLIPFGTIGYCAYKDLRKGKQTYSCQQFSSDF